MKDNRPAYTPMPAEYAALGDELAKKIKAVMDEAWADGARVPGDLRINAMVENDRISMMSQLAAYATLQVLGRTMMQKSIIHDIAWPIIALDIEQRVAGMMAQAMENAAARAAAAMSAKQ